MSGGAYDYAYSHIEYLANNIRANTPERRAFVALLQKVAEAAHAIEWVDSGDYAEGDEVEPIMKCVTSSDTLASEIERATALRDELTALIERLGK